MTPPISSRLHPLAGTRALVTGGGSGIGRATARVFAEAGATVMVADIDQTNAATVTEELRGEGFEAHQHVVDVGDPVAVAQLVNELGDRLGGVDVVVNAAGQPTAYREGTPLEIWQRGLDQTLTSVMIVSRACIPMLVDGGGSIVNVSSIAAFGGSPDIAWYAAAKAGVLSLTRSLAVELGPQGVRVNAVCPGLTMTPRVTHLWENAAVRDTFIEQTPLRKIARPDDIAEAILFLASDRTAGQITGTHLLVDGGAASTKM
jgi:NAD(P)-dependent dehydrogenase (short-subunit alcohol dehydrogenase family)